jgi:hypothetical protein
MHDERSSSAEHAGLQECLDLTEHPQQISSASHPAPYDASAAQTTATEPDPQQQRQHVMQQQEEPQQNSKEAVAPLLDAAHPTEDPQQPSCADSSSNVQDLEHNSTLLELIPEEQQDTCQPSSSSSACDASLQLQQLLELNEQQKQQEQQQQLEGFDQLLDNTQQYQAQDQIWEQLQAAWLHQQATVIQR